MKSVPNAYPVESEAPDISAYKAGNTGVDYYTSFDSGQPGPHVLVNALVHGNELCGAIALDHLFGTGFRPLKGKLTLGFSNTEAYEAFDPEDPTTTRYLDEDFNRVWDVSTLDGERESRELTRAREIRPLIETVDYLLDIHSMQHKTPPLMISGPLDKGRALARTVASPAYIVSDAGHKAGRRLRDFGGFGDPASDKNALLIECGQHWESAAGPVAIDSVYRFLIHFGLADRDAVAKHLLPLPDSQTLIEVDGPVTIQTEEFRFAQEFTGMETLAKDELIGWDGEEEVRAPFDGCVLIMPTRRIWKGQTAVRLGRVIPAG
ncbi:MAG: M14 family metallopeptidase [Pseudomonadota bacterium]